MRKTSCFALAVTTTSSSKTGRETKSRSFCGSELIRRSSSPACSEAISRSFCAMTVFSVMSFASVRSERHNSGRNSYAPVGTTPILMCPACPRPTSWISRTVSSAATRNCRARANRASPAVVRRIPRPTRSNNGVPNAASSRRRSPSAQVACGEAVSPHGRGGPTRRWSRSSGGRAGRIDNSHLSFSKRYQIDIIDRRPIIRQQQSREHWPEASHRLPREP